MKSAILLILFTLFSIDVSGADVKVSVMVGDSVTLHTDDKVQPEDVLQWYLNKTDIATIDEGDDEITASDVEFKGRLQLDSQTGDLKIRNIKTKDSGDYTFEITRVGGSPKKTFSVSVVSDDTVKSMSVLEGDSVTLLTGLTDIKKYDVIKWRFGGLSLDKYTEVAEISAKSGRVSTSFSSDGRFRGRLQLDNQTGSLNITNVRTTLSGLYEVDISSSGYTIHKTFSVTGSADMMSFSVMVGHSVTLPTNHNKIQTDEQILWTFGEQDILIADLNGRVNNTWNINVNPQTGDLNISNIHRNQNGDYKVEIWNNGRMILHSKYHIDVVESLSVMVGDSVTLHTNFTIIRNKHVVSWFDKQGNHITGLTINDESGDLTIRNIQSDQSGDYKVKISSSSATDLQWKFHVNISGEFSNEKDGVKTLSVTNGESILLYTHVTEIQNIPVEWIFVPQNISIVKTDGKSNPPLYSNNERFKNILDLNNQTGDLSINNSNTDHSGVYQLKIINRAYTIQKSFNVTVKQLAVSVSDQSYIAWIVVGVIVAAVVAVGLAYYCIKKRKQERHRENGQNHRTQDTVDTVNEETILNNDS